jgi:hypothetical protein
MASKGRTVERPERSLEAELRELLRKAAEESPVALEIKTGVRPPLGGSDPLADHEPILLMQAEVIGGLREAVFRLAREIDQLRGAGGQDVDER